MSQEDTIARLVEREREATAILNAFRGPDNFLGWHNKYSAAIVRALQFLGDPVDATEQKPAQ